MMLGLASVFGLVAAQLSDGIGDVLSWAALAAPTAVVLWVQFVSRAKAVGQYAAGRAYSNQV